jgi:glutamate-ammonia-ligase adenylyltransferase
MARALVRALDEVDAEGFVFRTDLRLRPHGDAGPLVISLPMLEEYLLREGRAWERFAWAKARVIEAPAQADAAGHARQREALREIVEPFVFRRYLDFGTIDAVADLHRRIGTASRARALRAGAATDTDPDIKTGRGGIREVEFLVQMFCVMRGGREPALRAAGTLAGLAALGRLGLLGLEQVRALEADYRLLRRVEHALQYRDDAQTHRLPQDSAAWEAVAVLAGFGDGAALRAALDACRGRVQAAFDQAMPDTPATAGEAQGRRGAEALLRHGFAPEQAQDAARRLQDLLASPRVAAMGPAGQTLVAGLADQALEWIATAGSGGGPLQAPERLLQRWIALVEVIGRRGTYFSLLAAYPRAHHSVLRLLATGGWASDYLMRHPILLDELIDGDSGAVQAREWAAIAELPGAAEPAWRDWANSLEARLAGFGDDEERQLNLLRDAHHAAVFRLLLADLSGQLPLERLADHLSALADAVIGVALRGAWRQLVPGGGEPPLAVIAYGKLGGRELGYASDLDLAFLVEEGAGEEFERAGTRLARRLVLWLTSATSSGQLFEVDLRLRPNGEAGLLVLPFAAFERYQRNADGHGAWTWEHQALTRARVCAGSAGLRASFDALREAILASDRDAPSLLESVQSMRARMLAGHPNRSGDFDIKHDRGGMVDVEFAVQALVLRHAARVPELLPNVGNLALLGRAARAGLLDTALAADAARAYRDYRGWQHAARLAGAERVRVPAGQAAVQRAAVGRLWDAVLAD